MTDRDRLLTLLASLHDDYPDPETWTGRMLRRALVVRAPAPVSRATCPTCQGKGRRGAATCDVCEGRGSLIVDPMTYWDPRTGKARPREAIGNEETGALRSMDRRELDAAIRRLELGEAAEVKDAEEHLLAALERRQRAGSYLELDRALESLRAASERSWRLVLAVHVEGRVSASSLVPSEAVRLERSLAWLEALMPAPVRVPRHLQEQLGASRESRAQVVVRLRDEGLEVPAICRRVGLQRSRVYEILAAHEARRVEERTAA